MPHIGVPIRRTTRSDGTGGVVLFEQDSPEDVDACTFAVLNTRVGHRTDLPEFGTPGQAFRRGGADLAAIERCVALWEPRADLIALRETGALERLALEQGADTVKVKGP